MSLIKVHEYLTKQQHPSSSSSTSTALTNVEQLIPSSTSSTPPIHHQSYSTLTSVTYRSSLAKHTNPNNQPISTPSSASDFQIHHLSNDGNNERRNSIISDIHHLTHSPNTFETSIISNSSSNSNQNQCALSYLIEQNQRMLDQEENYSLYSEIQYAVDDLPANTTGKPCEKIATMQFED